MKERCRKRERLVKHAHWWLAAVCLGGKSKLDKGRNLSGCCLQATICLSLCPPALSHSLPSCLSEVKSLCCEWFSEQPHHRIQTVSLFSSSKNNTCLITRKGTNPLQPHHYFFSVIIVNVKPPLTFYSGHVWVGNTPWTKRQSTAELSKINECLSFVHAVKLRWYLLSWRNYKPDVTSY